MSIWLFRKRKRVSTLSIVLILTFVVLSCSGTSLSMGKGEIEKLCIWENEVPIVGAEVFLDSQFGGKTLFTNAEGKVVFTDLLAGEYFIFVDIDDDGIWDGEVDVVSLESGEHEYVVNMFPLPKIFKSCICFLNNMVDVEVFL